MTFVQWFKGVFDLSTPSLGITPEVGGERGGSDEDDLSTPSLGITELARIDLHDILLRIGILSTPSLGITSADSYADMAAVDGNQLSTPSLGITGIKRVQERLLLGLFLSTPSLGITKPSGIFRLSAAFCRGTPSHK